MESWQRTPCIEWAGHRDKHGYAYLGPRRAYRLAYEKAKGEIPPGLEIDHLCNNRGCVNPEHLEAVTHAENQRRRSERQTHCRRGHLYDEENTHRAKNGKRTCRECRRDWDKRWREEHPEAAIARDRKKYAANAERRRESRRTYYARNREQVREAQRAYRTRKREERAGMHT